MEYVNDLRAKNSSIKIIFTGTGNETEAKDLWVNVKQLGAGDRKKQIMRF